MTNFSQKQLRYLVLALVAILGCDRPDTAALPPLPRVELTAFEPAVAEQLRPVLDAIAANPKDAEANGKLGMLFNTYAWLDRALVCYRRASLLEPSALRWWYYLARVQSEMGQRTEAIESLLRATECAEEYFPVHLLLGELYLGEQDLENARRWFAHGLKLRPRSAHALHGLGQVSFEQGAVKEAIGHYKKALDLAPEFGRAKYSLALAYRADGELAEARRLLAGYPSKMKPLEADDALLAEVRELRRDADDVFRSANDLMKQGKHSEAIELYKKALVLNPGTTMAEYNIGLALHRMRRPREALPYYQRVLQRRPDSLETLNNLGTCLLETGEIDTAIEYFEKSVNLEPRYYKGHFNLALAYENKKQVDLAIARLETALSIRPRYAEAHFNLGRLYSQRGDQDRAQKHFLQVLAIRPDDERVHRMLLSHFTRQSVTGTDAESTSGSTEGARAGAGYRQLAAYLMKNRLYGAAIHALRARLREVPTDWRSTVTLAWLLATCEAERFRDPGEAVRLLEPICSGVARDRPQALDTLAVSYAASGRLEDAMATGTAALRLAEKLKSSPGMADLAAQIEARLESYRLLQKMRREDE